MTYPTAAAVGLTLLTSFVSSGRLVNNQINEAVVISPTDSCGGDYDGTKGKFSSPNYPGDYPNGTNCVWRISSPPNTKISVNFEDFNVHYTGKDYLEIRDGYTSDAPLLQNCTYLLGCFSDTSTSNTLYFKFSSNDDSNIARGFELNWFSGLPDVHCYHCGNHLEAEIFDPACGVDNYHGHEDRSYKWNACYTNVHYDGSHFVERGGTENYQEENTCIDTGFSLMCYCMHERCNKDLCQDCSTTAHTSVSLSPTHTTIKHSSIATTNPPATSTQLPTTSQSPTPDGALACFSCIGCNTVNEVTQVEISDEFLSCFTAIELGNSKFVIRGGSPDAHVDGTCRQVDGGLYECYCNSNKCNSDGIDKLLEAV